MNGAFILEGHKFFVCDEFPASEGGTCKSPETLGGTGVRITLLVDDADRAVEREVTAGARVSMPVQDMLGRTFWKDRRYFRPRVGDQPTGQRAESRRDSGRG
jgi:uncharacterized glyoxalase superfamily protein PhnB